LESQLSHEKAQRKTERFFWIFVVVFLVEAYLASNVGWWQFTLVTALAIVFLIGIANWMEVPWIVRHLEACLAIASNRFKSDASKETE
jgi:hypothetical protein